ncbi:uncharacterized protein LOC135304182 [Passer domesticus]|uniref:uncharacterized protein LOC135304182 n=1 Tax=Passer domesticus TaxID=48849 RepID=UPI0030FE1A61
MRRGRAPVRAAGAGEARPPPALHWRPAPPLRPGAGAPREGGSGAGRARPAPALPRALPRPCPAPGPAPDPAPGPAPGPAPARTRPDPGPAPAQPRALPRPGPGPAPALPRLCLHCARRDSPRKLHKSLLWVAVFKLRKEAYGKHDQFGGFETPEHTTHSAKEQLPLVAEREQSRWLCSSLQPFLRAEEKHSSDFWNCFKVGTTAQLTPLLLRILHAQDNSRKEHGDVQKPQWVFVSELRFGKSSPILITTKVQTYPEMLKAVADLEGKDKFPTCLTELRKDRSFHGQTPPQWCLLSRRKGKERKAPICAWAKASALCTEGSVCPPSLGSNHNLGHFRGGDWISRGQREKREEEKQPVAAKKSQAWPGVLQ